MTTPFSGADWLRGSIPAKDSPKANSPWGDIYASFWNYEVHLQIGEFNFSMAIKPIEAIRDE